MSLWLPGGRIGEEIAREFGMVMNKLLYLKWITSKALLYSTGNSAQCYAEAWMGGGRDWGQEEKGTTEDEMAVWHHWLDGHESEWTLGVGDGHGGLVCCNSWGCKESDLTERLNWTEYTLKYISTDVLFFSMPLLKSPHTPLVIYIKVLHTGKHQEVQKCCLWSGIAKCTEVSSSLQQERQVCLWSSSKRTINTKSVVQQTQALTASPILCPSGTRDSFLLSRNLECHDKWIDSLGWKVPTIS